MHTQMQPSLLDFRATGITNGSDQDIYGPIFQASDVATAVADTGNNSHYVEIR